MLRGVTTAHVRAAMQKSEHTLAAAMRLSDHHTDPPNVRKSPRQLRGEPACTSQPLIGVGGYQVAAGIAQVRCVAAIIPDRRTAAPIQVGRGIGALSRPHPHSSVHR